MAKREPRPKGMPEWWPNWEGQWVRYEFSPHRVGWFYVGINDLYVGVMGERGEDIWFDQTTSETTDPDYQKAIRDRDPKAVLKWVDQNYGLSYGLEQGRGRTNLWTDKVEPESYYEGRASPIGLGRAR